MSQLVATAPQTLKEAICAALNTAMEQGSLPRAELPPCMLEIPADRSHGDWSCNIAMAGARVFRTAPLKIAQAVKAALDLSGTYFKTCEIAGPGFLNFTYDNRLYGEGLTQQFRAGKAGAGGICFCQSHGSHAHWQCPRRGLGRRPLRSSRRRRLSGRA